MKRLAIALAALCGLIIATPAVAANKFGDSAHSHWDIHTYADHEITFCYVVIAKATGADTRIANLPHRETDGPNNMELRLHTDGFRLVVRINGHERQLTPIVKPATPLAFGPGSEVMADYTMIGDTFTLYDFTGGVRGAMWYQWRDSTYPTGRSVSYYTIGGWSGEWEEAHGRPLDSTGHAHDLLGLFQDARNHPQVAGEATFDSAVPANGGASGITASSTFGLPSGTNYHYDLTVAGSGSGYFAFRLPRTDGPTVEHGWYRLTPGKTGAKATVVRYNSNGTAAKTYTATVGGPGQYHLTLTGPNVQVIKDGVSILTVNDPAGATAGLRVKASPASGQTITWSGAQDT